MERELFTDLLAVLGTIPGARHRPYKSLYTTASLLAVAFWAALHERPIDWATQRRN